MTLGQNMCVSQTGVTALAKHLGAGLHTSLPASAQRGRCGPRFSASRSRIAYCSTSTSTLEAVAPSSLEKLNWRQSWWPVAFTRDLDASRPSTMMLLDEQLCLWYDGSKWNAFADRCPHRLAPLSEGRVTEEGNIECPYHGWAFSRSGTCEVLPQESVGSDAARSKPRACATAYEVQEKQGMLFVRMETPAASFPAHALEPPTIPELDDPRFVCIDIARDLPYDYVSLLENVLDVSHVPFTHHLTVSNRANGGPVELEVLSPGVQSSGFNGNWAEGPRKGKLGPQATKFVAPSLMYHSLEAASLGTTLTVVYATPASPGKSRLLARFPFRFNAGLPKFIIGNTPRWFQHQGQNGVLEDDVVFLAVGEKTLAAAEASGQTFAQACYMPLRQDAYVLAFRQWLSRFTDGGAPWAPGKLLAAHAAATPTRDMLLDRYLSHTKDCIACSGALKNVRSISTVVAAIGAVAALALTACLTARMVSPIAALPVSPLALLAIVAGTIAAWLRLKAMEKGFLVGPSTPKRNLIVSKNANRGTKIRLV